MDTENRLMDDSDLFPLRTIGDARKLFERHLSRRRPVTAETDDSIYASEPNLVLLSIVIGAIENNMTIAKSLSSILDGDSSLANDQVSDSGNEDVTPTNLAIEPPLDWSTVETLFKKFDGIIRGFCDVDLLFEARASSDKSDPESFEKVRRLIKHVADIVWNTLSKSHYKDKPHLQSIYSYLTGNKLDCFGVAFAVVAACQLLQVPNVHLALSEDHAWVVFGADGTETAEVTWHGKGNEDKRGRPVEISKAKTSWLYLAGQPVVCDRYVEVAAIVSSINPSVNSNCDSIEVGALQQELLWLLYDSGHLKTYPMALGNLADLEEISPSLGRPSCEAIFSESINADRSVYSNHHVYPYTYQAGYYYRKKNYVKALQVWAGAADVIKLYRYSKDDEEIYKEFMEIANELIPSIVKNPTSDILNDAKSFANILRFYDGVCSWEEGSPTPVLHITWAKHMVATCSKFSSSTRAGTKVEPDAGDGGDGEEEEDDEEDQTSGKFYSTSPVPPSIVLAQSEDNNNYYKTSNCDSSNLTETRRSAAAAATYNCDISNSHCLNGKIEAERSVRYTNNNNKCQNNILIEKLSSSCADHLLNIDYLLGKANRPFLEPHKKFKLNKFRQFTTAPKKGRKLNDKTSFSEQTSEDAMTTMTSPKIEKNIVSVHLHSAKMRGLRNLLCAEKMNTSAITLQLTAQSQMEVTSQHRRSTDDLSASTSRSKRPRRDN